MKDVVIVNVNPMHKPIIEQYGLDVVTTRRELHIVMRIVRSLLLRLNPYLIYLFNKTNWLQEIKDYDTVVIFDSLDIVKISKDVADSYPEKKVVVLYINPIRGSFQTDLKQYAEVWTTDYEDSLKFGLKYGGQFIYEKYLDGLPKSIKYDLYFVGIDKGRFKHIKELEKKLTNDFEMTTNIRYVSPIKSLFDKSYSRRIPYSKVMTETAQSRMILEYNQEGQEGLTLRCIEALVMRKKIITNNKNIKKYDFYNPNNIYIIQDDSLKGLKEFISGDYTLDPEKMESNYYFSSLLNRILSDRELKDRK